MPWIKETCENIICGVGLGFMKGAFGVSLFSKKEVEEISSLKKLVLSVVEKSPELTTDPLICEAIKNGQQSALDSFVKSAPTGAATVIATAEIVCNKAFKERFKDVLMGACLNLTGC